MVKNPVALLDKTTRDARLLSSFTKGDRVRQSARHPGEWLVSSSQNANIWYRVAYDMEQKRYSCGCQWWSETQTACRHLTRVAWEDRELRKRERAQAQYTSAAAD